MTKATEALKNVFQSAKLAVRKLSFYFKTPLPIGMAEFDEWADSILNTYGYPNNDSTRFALAAMIMHLGQTEGYKPKRFFVLCLRKGAASQVAGATIQNLKAKQEAEKKAALESAAVEQKKNAEATASPAVASLGLQ
jgi:hypothetical protein